MEEEQKEVRPAAPAPRGKSPLIRVLIFSLAAIIVLGLGGFAGYTMLYAGKTPGTTKPAVHKAKSALVALDPFVVNLTEPGRYLKVTIQFEIEDESNNALVTSKMPNLRDAIITILSSKSPESVAAPEGKFQLKDELLLRANQAVGKDIFKTLFFTEFVMQ